MAMPKGKDRNPGGIDDGDDRYDASGVGAEGVVRRASAKLLDLLVTIHPNHFYRAVILKRGGISLVFAALGYWAVIGIPQDLTDIV